MEQLITHTGLAAPLMRDSIDTDILIPSREMTSTARDGYGEKLMANWRYLPSESDQPRIENPDFVLNQPAFRHASILIAGSNFGSVEPAPGIMPASGLFGCCCSRSRKPIASSSASSLPPRSTN